MAKELITAGADVNKQDSNNWSALMWAMTNRHKGIAKLLLDNGASAEAKTSSGRTAFDFVAPDSDMSFYLSSSGYGLGTVGVTDDFYQSGFTQDRFEEELAENEMRRRMMMESARDLEVDLGNMGIDDQPEVRSLLTFGHTHKLTPSSRSRNSRRNSQSSTGRNAFMTKCLFSKNMTWIASSTLSSPT